MQDVTFLNILPLESLTFTPELVASSCGYFEDHKLNVKFETTQGSAQAIQTVIAGGALITRVGDMETMVATGEKHAPLVNVGQINKTGTIRFVSDKSDPLKTAADLKDRLMGTPSEGGTSELIIKVTAASAGINPDDVKTQVVGLAPGVFDLVKSGRIGGYVVSLDTAVALQKQQPDAVIYSPSDDVQSGGQVYITSKDQADDPDEAEATAQLPRGDQGRRAVRREGRGQRLRRDHQVPLDSTTSRPSRTRRSARPRSPSTSSRGPRPATTRSPGPCPSSGRRSTRRCPGRGFVPKGQNPKDWFTNDFAPGS